MTARPGELIHVAGPLWLVVGQGQGRFPHSNSILVRDTETALIDTGCGVDVLRALDGVDRVINTHTHPDHSAGNFVFAGLPILVPEQGAATAGDLQALSGRFFAEEHLRPVWRRFIREQMRWADQPPTGTFAGGQELRVGSTTLVALPSPGHTIDHCCLFVPEHGALVGGDIDLTRFGPWYGHPESDLAQLRRSIEAIRRLEPSVVISAHRPPVRRDVDGALQRFAGVLDQRERRLLELLAVERSWDQIVDAALVYGRFPYEEALMRSWEGEMIRKHLDQLMEDGRVERTEGGYRATASP